MKKIFAVLLLFILFSSPVFADLSFSDANISFGVIKRPKAKTVKFCFKNDSDCPFLGRISSDSKWLKIASPDFALNPGEDSCADFTVDSKDIVPGDYKGQVTFSSMMGAVTQSVPVFVTIVQGKDDPILTIENQSFDFGDVTRGENPLEKIWVENSGSGVVDIELKYPSWMLSEEKVSLRAGQKRPIFIRAMTRELVPDKYTAEMIFKTNTGDKIYPVSINVVPRPEDPILSASPGELDFGIVNKGKRGRKKMTIVNDGKTTADLTIAYPDYVVDTPEEVKELKKDKQILVVIETKSLPKGITKDKIRIVSKYKVFDIPIKINVK